MTIFEDGNRNICQMIKSTVTSDNNLNPLLPYVHTNTIVKFNGSCLKQYNITYTHGKKVNLYNVYEINKKVLISSYPTQENCFFGTFKLAKSPAIDKCKYSEYGIGFDRKGTFSVGNGFGRNCIYSEVAMSSSVHFANKKKRYYNYWWRYYTKIRWSYINCRKNVSN